MPDRDKIPTAGRGDRLFPEMTAAHADRFFGRAAPKGQTGVKSEENSQNREKKRDNPA